jgi:hypothetical protein
VGVAAVLSLGFAIASPHLPLDRWTTRLAPGKSVKDLGLEAKIPGLARGRHLVALLDLGDPGAVEVADRLNEIAARPGAPTVVALTPSSEEETTAFIWSAVPDFEIHPIDRPELKPLYRLLPRFFLVDAGRVTAIFDGSGPPAPDLLLSE